MLWVIINIIIIMDCVRFVLIKINGVILGYGWNVRDRILLIYILYFIK